MGEAKRNSDRHMKQHINRTMRALALEGHGRLIRRTPVDKGTARANWNVEIGRADLSTNEGLRSSDVPTTQARGRMKTMVADFFGGDVLTNANGLPYIEMLEDGYSQQAPAGMVKVTVEELRPIARQLAQRNRVL